MSSAKETFLEHYDREHAVTMNVLRAYPEDQLDLKPSAKSNSARDLAWIFVLERGLGETVWHDGFAKGTTKVTGKPPLPPEQWSELVATLEQAHQKFRDLIAAASDDELLEEVHFFTAPKTMGPISRLDWIWFLLHDQIHHRSQFSVYLRMAGGKVPSIYGPTADEPWI
ncbi:MAG TPA: DinB family protein [Thermoanaerobaculia bacterium]|nr:DinB family protein [Thermoanaerobaculia bacterium]